MTGPLIPSKQQQSIRMESKAIMNWILTGCLAMLTLVCLAGPFIWVVAITTGGHITMVNFVAVKGADTMANSKYPCEATKSSLSTMAAFAFILFFLCIGHVVVQALITLEKLRFGVVAIALSGVCSLVAMIEFALIAAFYHAKQCDTVNKDVFEYGSAIGLYIMLWFVFAFFAVANFFVNGIKSE